MQSDERNGIETATTALLHPASRQLFRYWEALRAARACPLRSEIDLSAIAPLLSKMSILEKSASGIWIYRLAGTEVCDLLHQPMTNKDALIGFDRFAREVISKTFDYAQAHRQPCLVRMRLISKNNDGEPVELLGLPVNDERAARTMLFGGLFGFGQNPGVRTILLRRELISARLIWTEHARSDQLRAQQSWNASPHLRVIQGGLSTLKNVLHHRS